MDRISQGENTYVANTESVTEIVRLVNQDRAATQAMGGPLMGLPELQPNAQVIDLACGPGGWVLDVAFAKPEFEVCGVDISRTMVAYANTRAVSQGLNNASFGVMNINQRLDFDDSSFDMVNARFLVGVLKREAWQPFIAECTRILRPGGILRLTEACDPGITSSPTFEQLTSLFLSGMWRAGYGFSPTGRTFGMPPALRKLLSRAGYTDIHTTWFGTDSSADVPGWSDFYHNYEIGLMQLRPLLISLDLTKPEEFEKLYEQALLEMHDPDFACMVDAFTVWGISPSKG